jgi:DNA primase
MAISIEQMKSLDMVGLLTRFYGLEFKKVGTEYVAFSPFRQEKEPSFFVRHVDGHWLFKDFSSGHGGSLIDFILIKENFHEVSEVLVHIRKLLGGQRRAQEITSSRGTVRGVSYDIRALYAHMQRNDVSPSCEYLRERGISEEVVDELVRRKILLYNRCQGKSYCCFAVRDEKGELWALDNHQVDGAGKFVLGKKHIFSLDWNELSQADEVFVTEGVVDYLSMKTLEGIDRVGFAMLGNIVLFSPEVLSRAFRIISALDDDDGGLCGFLDLLEMFPDKEIERYDLEDYNDPNELLKAVKEQKRTRLSSKRKLELYRQFVNSSNKSEIARQWGIDRSYLYEIVRECEQMILEGFEEREPGRKPTGRPQSLKEAWERIEQLEREKYRETVAKETYYARSEFLKVRLKYAQGDEEDTTQGVASSARQGKKKQIKKKRRERR